MCDYSAEGVPSRSAVVGDALVSGPISWHTTGFVAKNDGVAVCLLPGTELAFDRPVSYKEQGGIGWDDKPKIHIVGTGYKVARFTQVNMDKAKAYHDALELPDGEIVLLHQLTHRQEAKVLQLPAPKAHGDSGTDDTVVQPTEFDLGDGLVYSQPALEIVRG